MNSVINPNDYYDAYGSGEMPSVRKKSYYSLPTGITVLGRTKVYDTYEEMLSDKSPGEFAWVMDASGDSTVDSGAAFYHRKDRNWQKLYESEAMDSEHGVIPPAELIALRERITILEALVTRIDSSVYPFVGFDFNAMDFVDYSAFEVLPTNSIIYPGYNTALSGNVTESIPACMTEKFTIRSTCAPSDSDVVVAWGDGSITAICDPNAPGRTITGPNAENEWSYALEHTYAESKKHIIKIYGHKYYSFCHPSGTSQYNLMSRIFDGDLPIASHLHNFSSLCLGASRLINVQVNGYDAWCEQADNLSYAFSSCKNLLKCVGFRHRNNMQADDQIFAHCRNLAITDYKLKNSYTRQSSAKAQFQDTTSLAVDINQLLPESGFSGTINMNAMFNGCLSLSGTVPAEKFWENPYVKFINTSTAFLGCSLAIRAQVPVSWGGTNTDIEEKLQSGYWKVSTDGIFDDQFREINNKIQTLNNKITI